MLTLCIECFCSAYTGVMISFIFLCMVTYTCDRTLIMLAYFVERYSLKYVDILLKIYTFICVINGKYIFMCAEEVHYFLKKCINF